MRLATFNDGTIINLWKKNCEGELKINELVFRATIDRHTILDTEHLKYSLKVIVEI